MNKIKNPFYNVTYNVYSICSRGGDFERTGGLKNNKALSSTRIGWSGIPRYYIGIRICLRKEDRQRRSK